MTKTLLMLLPQSHFPSNKKKSKSERYVTTMIGVVKSMIGLLVDEGTVVL